MAHSLMTTVKLPKKIYQKLLERVVSDGLGLRGKSKWIIHAIETFLQMENYPELVDIASEMDLLTEVLSMRLPMDVVTRLDSAVIETRRLYPALEGVRSSIIRASIIQNLIR
jgi:hypothetical protein